MARVRHADHQDRVVVHQALPFAACLREGREAVPACVADPGVGRPADLVGESAWVVYSSPVEGRALACRLAVPGTFADAVVDHSADRVSVHLDAVDLPIALDWVDTVVDLAAAAAVPLVRPDALAAASVEDQHSVRVDLGACVVAGTGLVAYLGSSCAADVPAVPPEHLDAAAWVHLHP